LRFQQWIITSSREEKTLEMVFIEDYSNRGMIVSCTVSDLKVLYFLFKYTLIHRAILLTLFNTIPFEAIDRSGNVGEISK
jgi:hypothetical protein